MKMMKTTLAALLTASLLGCAASSPTKPVKDVAVTAPACCSTFSAFSWIPMQGESLDFVVDEHAKVGQFTDGKSYYAGFALPQDIERVRVDLKSWMTSEGVFAPKVLLLDATFTPVKTIELDDFDVKGTNLLSQSSYRHHFEMDQHTTPYMVVYSPLQYREGEITIPHPERLRAEELGLARPMVADPVIAHQKFGSLTLDLNVLAMRAYRADKLAATAPAVAPAADKVPAPRKASPESSTSNMLAMLPETEAFYNAQITNAVANNDLHKALQLLEEAKRAGSTSAETTFVDLIKK